MSTTPQGVAQNIASPNEGTFQSLFDQGAFEPPKPVEGNRDQSGRFAKVESEAAAASPDAARKTEAAPVAVQPEAAPQGEQQAAPEGEGDEHFDSVEQFLEKHKFDANSFLDLPTTVKINGETKQVPLKDVIKSYQLEGHVQNKSQELSRQQTQFETERQTAMQLIQQQLITGRNYVTMAQNALNHDFQQVNWQQLKAEDPVKFMLTQNDFAQRQALISQGLQQIESAQQAEAQRLQQQQAALLPQEKARMLDALPEWKDPAKLQEGMSRIATYARGLGFNDAELNGIFDHRYIQVLNDAAQFRALQAANPEALKRVRAAPQMAKPGTRTNTDPKQVARTQAMDRFKANPRDQDAQAALFEQLI